MVRSSRCDKDGLSKGAWTAHEDQILVGYVTEHGEGKWGKLSRETGLKRCGKSCRLRWLNYLRPDIKRENITEDEEELINRLHKLLGNRWKLIAGRVPGRTDNEIKNYWNSISRKKANENQSERCKNERKTIYQLSAEAATLLKAEPTPTSCIDDEHLDTTSDGFLPVNGESDMMTWNFVRDLNAGKLSISKFLHTDFSKLSEFTTTIVDSTNGCRSGSPMSTSFAESPLYLQEWLNDWAADNSCLHEAARAP